MGGAEFPDISSTSNRKGYNMVEIIGKFLDSLYETSKSCNDFSVYEFQKNGIRIMDMLLYLTMDIIQFFIRQKIISSTSNSKERVYDS